MGGSVLWLILLIAGASSAEGDAATESEVVYQGDVANDGSKAEAEDEFGRAAIHGHHSVAANPHHVYPPPPLPPFLHHPGAQPSYHHGYEDDLVYESDISPYEKPDVYDKPDDYDVGYDKVDDHYDTTYEEKKKPYKVDHHYPEDDDYESGYGAEHPIDYVKPAIDKGLRQLEKLLETLYLIKDLVGAPPPKCPKPKVYPKENSCDPTKWSKCNCLAPATFTEEGRGNCNLGATKMDLQVWCYVENQYGNPEKICPDAKPSKSKPGYYWSRFACIT